MKNSYNLSIINSDTVRNIIATHPKQIAQIIHDAYLAHYQGQTINPKSYFLRFPDKPKARIIALPAAIHNDTKLAGIKWIASQPDNIQHGLPRASAIIILNDYDSGFPYACLEGSVISAVRTAHSAVLAADLMYNNQKIIRQLGIIGTGLIALTIYRTFLQMGWKIESLHLYDIDPSYAQNFADKVGQLHNPKIKIHTNYQTVFDTSDCVMLTTTATEPYINDLNFLKPQHKILNISLRDLSPEIVLSATNLVDNIEHILDANTSLHLAYKLCGHQNFIYGPIGQLLSSQQRLEDSKPIIFSPMGMGILDLALAQFVYQEAVRQKLDNNLVNFYQDPEETF